MAVGHDATLIRRGEPLVMRDVVVLGRHGQRGGALTCTTTITYAAEPLLVEQLALGRSAPGLRGAPGVIGPHRVVETLTCVLDPAPAG